ncbi:transcription cofactor vestigial-like protein 4 [Eucyclogobius newberryi]|uniref:transcription cofactor vestigial-like protein 4 n=1 Tax=Eucyclogobius newberryi TaxID=166745 RepID=UPI003B5CD1D7
MLVSMMDLLNSQLLDKMNNNLGRLYFEDEPRAASLSTSVAGITGPPSHCPSKRKYGDQMNSDDDHMGKMRLFASQMVRPSGNNHNEHWSYNPIPVDHLSASNSLHGNHLFASIPGFTVDQPLALTKSTVNPATGGKDRPLTAGSAQRKQNRPSVIICAPASNRNCNLSHCHMNGSSSQESDQKKADAQTECDPVIEEHFRRSLGKNYTEPESNSVSITGSVDDHFAKALGATWLQIKAKGGGPRAPEADP